MTGPGLRLAALAAVLVAVPLAAGCGHAQRTAADPAPTSPASSSASSSTAAPGSPSAGSSSPDAPATSRHTSPATPTPTAGGHGRTVPMADVAMTAPGRLTKPLLSPDVLVFSSRTLTPRMRARIDHLHGVVATEPFAMAQFYYHENEVTYAAVDPATFRRYTLAGTGETTAVWKRVAGGEIAVNPRLGKRIEDDRGFVRMGGGHDSPRLHIGAYAQLLDPRINSLKLDAVVNQRYVDELGMVPDNAMLLSTGVTAPQVIQKRLRAITGRTASVQILGPNFDVHAVQTAILTGQSVGAAVGTFNYTANADGTVNPAGGWVKRYIRTETVPILGRVTCNKEMLPQLVAALSEIQQRGLAKYLDPQQYGGCFVPRYIAGTHTLSNHAFGLALDLNVPGNQRGTAGQMNRQVVAVFEKWGFTWGGTWHYTDPMHFELNRIVAVG